ncbi:undecaprenyl/decaprenyl-phosphate alpha-N-acetylglucosaminyl 1-phosphate transferase [Candidatus Uhrbacteria bacterium]|nr:undecaprenyl/decaprenyl-phosphate alpha-N-acetylglucosaminyl 1-phosphate transferase [Candidatus Uhrbacteria bacterium]
MFGLFFVALIILSFVLAFSARQLAFRFGAIDQPRRTRDIHTKPIPLFGGLSIGILLITVVAAVTLFAPFSKPILPSFQIMGFLLGVLVLLIGGLLDDRFDLPAKYQMLFPMAAALIVILTGTTIPHITHWIGRGAYSLEWWRIGVFTFPADLLAFAWLLAVMYAMKFLDGLDGLVTGQTIIGALLIAGLAASSTFYQPAVAILALIVAAIYFGFLPHNIFPAKQFLGEAGSLIAGFSLGFLAIVSGAKVATALMALGLPLADASLVVLGRLARGTSPFRGDDTHLHFKLLKAGLTQRQVVGILWAIAALFGLLAFGLQTQGKVLLLIVLVGVTILLPYFVRLMRRSRIPKI